MPLEEAAREIGVDRRTLYRWLRDGRLKRYKGGIGDLTTYVDLVELRELRKPKPIS
jgi:excisionase family DNA binding protein